MDFCVGIILLSSGLTWPHRVGSALDNPGVVSSKSGQATCLSYRFGHEII